MNQYGETEVVYLMERLIRELEEIYRLTPEPSILTLPEIFGKQDQEVFATYWLAYLLNPQINGFGVGPLNALLRCIDANQVSEEDEIIIEREYTFENNGRRIDLLITTQEYLIGIENKLFSGEGDNQTESYWDGMTKIRDSRFRGKIVIGIYLKPEANICGPKCTQFKAVDYTAFAGALRSIEHDQRRDHRKNFYFYEFILYVEEKLMSRSASGFPGMSIDAKLYSENRKTLDQAKKSYDKFIKDLGDWLSERVKSLDDRFNAETPKDDYWQIFENDAWKKLNFHYELLWTKSGKRGIQNLTINDDVFLCIHLESANNTRKEAFLQEDKSLPYSKKIDVDFSNEAKSLKSVERIVDALKLPEFQDYAAIANKLIVGSDLDKDQQGF